MGAGKTSWSIQYMNDHLEKSILYVTPYLDEIERIQKTCIGRKIKTPTHKNGDTKLNDLNNLLIDGADIAISHALFQIMNQKSIEYIKDGGYTIIIDEALVVVKPYKFKHKDDATHLFESGLIWADDNDWIHWNQDKNDYDLVYNEIKNLANMNRLTLSSSNSLVWKYPSEIFNGDNEIFILTYMFESSYMAPYFVIENIDYEKFSVSTIGGDYNLVQYFKPDTTVYRDLITIFPGGYSKSFVTKRTVDFKGGALSKSWYDTNIGRDKVDVLRREVETYLKRKVDSKASNVMWTTFSNDKYRKIFKPSKSRLSSQGFVTCNAKGTNDFADRFNLAYLLNRYSHPEIQHYFAKCNIDFNWSQNVLSEMIQWVWRSRIRNREPINIYIPSKRMRTMLETWLNGGEI